IKEKTGVDSVVAGIYNYQVCFNQQLVQQKNLEEDKLRLWAADYLLKDSAVSQAFDIRLTMLRPMNETQRKMIANGYNQQRSGEVQIILKPGYIDAGSTGTTHGVWNPYDAHIPLLWYGWGIKHGATNKETYMTDIAATVAALLHIQMPSGCVGHVIEDVMKR
ncbi:MAG TPA: alkaline phosphatase family protein, partial [Chitinophagaceae bacterium]|nr:alkaline phosphatase family protein [Chitinophagaceae bacterium]